MRRIKQIIRSISVFILLLFSFLSCGKSGIKQPDGTFHYASFREIPGVTEDEIREIEALQKEYDSFVYGMTLTTEAFVDSLSINGEIKGYAALFCEWLTALFDIKFEPSLYNWGDLLAGLAGGEIDFTGDLMATEERRQVSFMTDPIAERSLKYFQIVGRPSIYEIARSRPPRLIFLNASAVLDPVSEAVDYDFEVVFVEDFIAAYYLMKNGEADALMVMGIVEASFDEFGDVKAETFLPQVFNSASMSTQNPKLMSVISVVHKALQDYDTRRYLGRLHNNGYREYLKNKLITQFTGEEREYIQNSRIVPVAADPGEYPGSFYDKHEKEWKGIFFDLLNEITLLTGLKFERVNDEYATWPVILKMLTDGQALIVPELIRTKEREGLFLWPSVSQMTDYYALISKSDYPNIQIEDIIHYKIGLTRNTSNTAIFRRWFPNQPGTVEYQSIEDAFDALQRGEIDLLMASQIRLLYLTHYMEFPDYKANLVFEQPVDIKFGINRDEAVLCSIIDKTLKMIDTNGITDQWMHKTYEYRVKLVEAQRPWLIGSSALFLSALALVAFLFVRNRRAGRLLELQSKEVLAASEAKGIFLATMSHEIRTPLNAIIGMTAIGKKSADMEIKNYTLEKIGDASTHLLGVINDILDMSKIEANKLELYPVEFNFERMLQKVITVINFRMAEKRQKFTVNIDEKTPRLLVCDDQRLAQVITNLLSNAVKFTPQEGEICLNVSLLGRKDGVCELRIEVADSGIGISPEQQKKLFSAFGQAESGISREFGGTGLGLAISKRIVNLMDGNIWIESEIGKGSRFIFTIIVPYGEENPRSQLAPGVTWEDLRVLAVDDSSFMCQYISGIFDQLGIHCEITEDGREACRIIEERGGFDIYFIDWRMPGMDGLELTKWIKSNGMRGKVILFSSAEMEEIREASLQSGADKCLIKPFLSSTIIDCLNECFGISGEQESRGHDNLFTGKTLLIVEDIEINREILLSLLEHTGINTDCAENGEEAVAIIKAAPEKYDAVLMDMQMPVMDGLEATRRIRAMSAPQCKKIPIIAMTANVFKDDIENCLAAGMNDHIGKPINIDEMFEKLRKFL
jgi:signal transduction histidine kinase/DNA-binding response OmpR family regulator